jgi:hypothetical protein
VPTSPTRFEFSEEVIPESFEDNNLELSYEKSREKESLAESKQYSPQSLEDDVMEIDSLQEYKVRKRKREKEPNFSLEKILKGQSSPQVRVLQNSPKIKIEKTNVEKENKRTKKIEDRVFQLSSSPYVAQPGQLSTSYQQKNSLFLADHLNVDGDEFDPLTFSIPSVMKEEILDRQKGISSDWPLIVTPSPAGSVEDKELFEKGVIQAQISNAAQMSLSMLLKGDYSTSILYLLDAYTLSTAAATAINNERVVLQYPGSEFILNGEEIELVRPKIKDLFSAFRSSTSVKNFFLSGGGTQVPSQYSQNQEKNLFLDRQNQTNPSRIQFSQKGKILSADQQVLVQEIVSQVQDALAQQRFPPNKPFRDQRFYFKRGNSKFKQKNNGGQFKKPPLNRPYK